MRSVARSAVARMDYAPVRRTALLARELVATGCRVTLRFENSLSRDEASIDEDAGNRRRMDSQGGS